MEQYKVLITGNTQRYNILGTIQNTLATWNSTNNTIYRDQSKIEYQLEEKMPRYNLQGTIEEITITRNNAKIQLTGNNRRNNNHKEQCQNTTYREQ